MAKSVYLRILGPLRVSRGDVEVDTGPHQQQTLLALLLAREGQNVSTHELIELLWGEESPSSALNIIHKYVGSLRRLLEPGLAPRSPGTYLARNGNAYRFRAGPETLDLVRFRRLVAEAKAAAGRDELGLALETYVEALRLGYGRAGDGLADSPAARATLANLDGEFSDAAVAAAEVAVRVRRPSRLLAPLQRAAAADAFNELVQASLVTTLAAAGRQAEALTVYRSIRRRLADELGIEPGPDLQDAYLRVLNQTVLPPAGSAAPILPVRPAQLPPDLPPFTGRVDELVTLRGLAAGLRDGGRGGPLVIALDGPAGVGKSTLAVHFAHLAADDLADGQLYLDLRGNEPDEESIPPGDALRSLLHGLGVRTQELPRTFDAQLGMYRSLTADKRILLLLDNVRDAAQVRPLLPSSTGSLVLLTSRRPLLVLAVRDGAHLLHVGVPDRRGARELLEHRIGGLAYGAGDTSLAVEEVVELCGRLPLALAILAARLAANTR